MRDTRKCDSTAGANLFVRRPLAACNRTTSLAAEIPHLPPCPHSPIQGSSREALGHLRDVDDFEFVQLIGRGFFGTVWKVREKHAERAYAGGVSYAPADSEGVLVMKVPITYGQLACHSSMKKIIQREDFMLRRLQHPNILKSRGLCIQRASSVEGPRWQLNLLIDYCDGGSLQQLIVDRQRPFPWLQRSLVLRDVCKAMNYVHSLGYMHRDLTSMNVLLQSQPSSSSSKFPKAVVADFGLSCRIPRPGEIFQQAGTSNWMSPEMLREEFYDEKSDVFSFGVIACQCIARIDADYDTGLYRTPQFGLDYIRFAVCCPPETPLALLKVAFMCCLMNPNSRPPFKSLERQLKGIIGNWELAPHHSPKCTSPEDIKLERSRSDAGILRSHPTTMRAGCLDASLSSNRNYHHLNPKRKSVTGNRPFESASRQRREKNLSLEVSERDCSEGERSRRSSSRLSTPAEQIKELAVSVANTDPSYEESCENPFARHSRYRSVRKMKPPDPTPSNTTPERRSATFSECSPSPLTNNQILAPTNTALKTPAAVEEFERDEDVDVTSSRPRSRSFSLPSSVVLDDSPEVDGDTQLARNAPFGTPANVRGSHARRQDYVLLGLRKTSLTVDAVEERDLRGKMTLSFRDYDQEFNSIRSNYFNTTHRQGRLAGRDCSALPGSAVPPGAANDFKSTVCSPSSPSSSSSASYDTCSVGEFESGLELTEGEETAVGDAHNRHTTLKNGVDSTLTRPRLLISTIAPTISLGKSMARNGGRHSHKLQAKNAASPNACRPPTSSTNHCCLT